MKISPPSEVGCWIYAWSSQEEEGTGDFNLRIISIERMEKRWSWSTELNADGEEV